MTSLLTDQESKILLIFITVLCLVTLSMYSDRFKEKITLLQISKPLTEEELTFQIIRYKYGEETALENESYGKMLKAYQRLMSSTLAFLLRELSFSASLNVFSMDRV